MPKVSTGQRIIDLDAVVPESIIVKMSGEEYELPGDIPVPDFLEIARIMDEIETGAVPEEGESSSLQRLYELALDLFRQMDPTIEELPIGPARLGRLVVMLYTGAADGDPGKAPVPARKPTRRRSTAGTKSSPRKKPTKSRSSK